MIYFNVVLDEDGYIQNGEDLVFHEWIKKYSSSSSKTGQKYCLINKMSELNRVSKQLLWSASEENEDLYFALCDERIRSDTPNISISLMDTSFDSLETVTMPTLDFTEGDQGIDNDIIRLLQSQKSVLERENNALRQELDELKASLQTKLENQKNIFKKIVIREKGIAKSKERELNESMSFKEKSGVINSAYKQLCYDRFLQHWRDVSQGLHQSNKTLIAEKVAWRRDRHFLAKDGVSDFFEQLERSKVKFVVFHPDLGHISLSVEEVCEYIADEDAFVSERVGPDSHLKEQAVIAARS